MSLGAVLKTPAQFVVGGCASNDLSRVHTTACHEHLPEVLPDATVGSFLQKFLGNFMQDFAQSLVELIRNLTERRVSNVDAADALFVPFAISNTHSKSDDVGAWLISRRLRPIDDVPETLLHVVAKVPLHHVLAARLERASRAFQLSLHLREILLSESVRRLCQHAFVRYFGVGGDKRKLVACVVGGSAHKRLERRCVGGNAWRDSVCVVAHRWAKKKGVG